MTTLINLGTAIGLAISNILLATRYTKEISCPKDDKLYIIFLSIYE